MTTTWMQYGDCRVLGRHQWRRQRGLSYPGNACVAIDYLCPACKTVRHDRVSWVTGEVVGRTYEHPDGYRVPMQDGKRVPITKLRAAYLRKIVRQDRREAA